MFTRGCASYVAKKTTGVIPAVVTTTYLVLVILEETETDLKTIYELFLMRINL